jgi:hypothetical protein
MKLAYHTAALKKGDKGPERELTGPIETNAIKSSAVKLVRNFEMHSS